MPPGERARTLVYLQSVLKAQEERRGDDGRADAEQEEKIRELRTQINALKDAELRANDLELTGGFVTSDRNAMDAFARELQGKAAQAKTQEQQSAQYPRTPNARSPTA